MTEGNLGGGRRTGSVKAAINMFGQRSTQSVFPSLDSPIFKSSPSVAEDFHISGRKLEIYKESGKASESTIAKAEDELSKAKKTVHELTLMLEKSNLMLKDVEKIKIDGNGELEDMKQELSKLKLDASFVSREKTFAEKELSSLEIKMEDNLKLLEILKLEVDVANEEHVLVELAKIEALKERKEIEEERKKTLVSLEKRKNKMHEMSRDIEQSKEVENVLSDTLSDIDMLETQLKLVKEMERKDNLSVLKKFTEEKEAKKEELDSINAEIFCVVNIIDALRQEIKKTKQEKSKNLQKDDVTINRLNKKLIMLKDRLKSVSEGQERINSLADNLTCSYEKLKNDKEVAKKEEIRLKEEATNIKNEIEKTEIGKEWFSKVDELERAKNEEILTLKKLESMVEKTMGIRENRNSRNITISRFEYEYLSGEASEARVTGDKKVEAAMAWVEALKASTKEILIKIETLERESGKTMLEEERESFRMKRSLSMKKLVQNEIQKFKKDSEDYNGLISPKRVRKSVRLSGKMRRYSLGNRGTPSYFVIKKKKKVTNLVKFFSRKRDKRSSLEQQ